ncbi:MAG: methionine synthase [Thermoplasmatales archaeon]
MMETQEIGSFRKPHYLAAHFKSLNESEFLKTAERATIETIDLFENAGLENIGVGGEMFRWEMYEHPISRIGGITIYGPVRSFDNRYYNKGSVVNELSRLRPFHVEEVKLLKKIGKKNVKVPITGPYTLMDWSFNDYYNSREELALAFSKILNEEIRELKALWGEDVLQIQIDEPAATTHPSEMDLVLESVNEAVKGVNGIETHIHVCYSSDYGLLFKLIPDLNVSVFNLEFANRDTISLSGERVGYADVKRFSEAAASSSRKIILGVGVTDVHINMVEQPDLIESRIKFALKHIDPDRIRLNPDCGLRTRSREIGFQKLKNMVVAREHVVKEL